MSREKNITSVNDLFTWEPTEVQSWLDSAWSEQKPALDEASWLGLAEVAATMANRSNDLEWARVSIRVYEWLHGVDSRMGYDRSAMNLRASMIRKLGGVSGDPLLDLQVILDWFWNNVPMSITEARFAIPNCQKTIAEGNVKRPEDLELCRKLRRIKNDLNLLWWLMEDDILVPDEELKAWVELKPELP